MQEDTMPLRVQICRFHAQGDDDLYRFLQTERPPSGFGLVDQGSEGYAVYLRLSDHRGGAL
jgi:hypothetical protein